MLCPRCGQEMDVGAKECGHCGVALLLNRDEGANPILRVDEPAWFGGGKNMSAEEETLFSENALFFDADPPRPRLSAGERARLSQRRLSQGLTLLFPAIGLLLMLNGFWVSLKSCGAKTPSELSSATSIPSRTELHSFVVGAVDLPETSRPAPLLSTLPLPDERLSETERALLEALGLGHSAEAECLDWIRDANGDALGLLAQKRGEKAYWYVAAGEAARRIFPSQEESAANLSVGRYRLLPGPEEGMRLLAIPFNYGLDSGQSSALFSLSGGRLERLNNQPLGGFLSVEGSSLVALCPAVYSDLPLKRLAQTLPEDFGNGEPPAFTAELNGRSLTEVFLGWGDEGLGQLRGSRISTEELRAYRGADSLLETIHDSGATAYAIYAYDNHYIQVNYFTLSRLGLSLRHVLLKEQEGQLKICRLGETLQELPLSDSPPTLALLESFAQKAYAGPGLPLLNLPQYAADWAGGEAERFGAEDVAALEALMSADWFGLKQADEAALRAVERELRARGRDFSERYAELVARTQALRPAADLSVGLVPWDEFRASVYAHSSQRPEEGNLAAYFKVVGSAAELTAADMSAASAGRVYYVEDDECFWFLRKSSEAKASWAGCALPPVFWERDGDRLWVPVLRQNHADEPQIFGAVLYTFEENSGWPWADELSYDWKIVDAIQVWTDRLQ